MAKGTRVLVSHPMMPGRKFEGVVVGKNTAGIRVRYESFGAMFTETFFPTRVEAI
jgi:hypothetical protein